MISLSGKKMVVIGGSRGIGRRIVEAAFATARRFSRWLGKMRRSSN